MKQTFFITGTDTGVGKTLLTALLTRFLRERGVTAAALKPICSGGRGDVRALHAAMNGALTLDEINPRHFRAPIAPLLAARLESKRVKPASVLAHIRAMQKRFDVLLVEGAGGLLSPLGGNFNSRDLITTLRATPIIVCQNRLGAVNQVLLTFKALPKNLRKKTRVVLMSPSKPDASAKTNTKLLGQILNSTEIFSLPWLDNNIFPGKVFKNAKVKRMLQKLAQA